MPTRRARRFPPQSLPAGRAPARALLRVWLPLLAVCGVAVTPVGSGATTLSYPDVVVAPASLPPAAPGAAYSQTITASGGLAPYTFAVTAGALPPGLGLDGAGLLSGTASTTGNYAFTVTATATDACTGSTDYTLSVPAIPAAVGDLAATRQTSGNDADGTARIQISFTPTGFTTTSEVYRAAFGGYPRYDDAGGLTPPTPSYPPGAPWVLTAVTASGQTDEPATRDAWSYVVFGKNALGLASAVSNTTPPTPNYALGDVSDGVTAGAGDNLVNDLDISLLGAHYGISGGAVLSAGVSYLDVGPTVDFAVNSRPFTDARIDFEDLIVFATNYGVVSSPAALVAAANASARAATAAEHLSVDAPARVALGATFDAVVRMEARGRVQGLSAELGWDPAVAEPVAVTGAGWVESQHGVVWSARPGAFDAVLLGARARGLAGAGDVARVTFRARMPTPRRTRAELRGACGDTRPHAAPRAGAEPRARRSRRVVRARRGRRRGPRGLRRGRAARAHARARRVPGRNLSLHLAGRRRRASHCCPRDLLRATRRGGQAFVANARPAPIVMGEMS